jgi:hypothetical protein
MGTTVRTNQDPILDQRQITGINIPSGVSLCFPGGFKNVGIPAAQTQVPGEFLGTNAPT